MANPVLIPLGCRDRAGVNFPLRKLRPGSLLKASDMKPFSVYELISLVRALETLASTKAVHSDEAISDDAKKVFAERTDRMQALCEECELTISSDQFCRISSKLRGTHPVTYRELVAFLPDAMNRIEDETSRQIVMVIEPAYLVYFSNPQFFDSRDQTANKVSVQFASAAEDIAEAGKCLACGRSTACVMHLNRVMEVGLQSLAKELGISPQNDWGKYLREIETELTRRLQTSGARTADEQFYAETHAMFDSVRRAWRNPTMHVDKTYTEERAEEILISVRSFLRHLATKLHE